MKTLLRLFLGMVVLGFHAASAADWMTNYNDALALAAKQDRMVLLDFTGSDWCPPCMKLHEDIFEKPEFSAFAKDKLVTVMLDFPRSKALSPELKKQNEALAQKYGVQGFPTLILLTPQGKEIDRKVGYFPGGPAAFAKWVASAK
jgi:thioredoxin-related protein